MNKSFAFAGVWLCVACGGSEDRAFDNPDGSAGASGGAATGGGGVGGTGAGGTGAGGTGGTGGAAGAGGGAAGVGGGPGNCNLTTHACVAPPPAGWTGPVAFYEGASAPPCPGTYPTVQADGKTNVVEGSASCSCTCGPATGVTCNSGQATILDVGEGPIGCSTSVGAPTVWTGAVNGCAKAIANSSGQVLLNRPSPTSVGSCASTSAHTLPTVATDDARLCGGTTAGAGTCDGSDVCLPQAFAPYRMCIERPGEFDCPAGYTDKTLVHEAVNDTRACSACSCSTPNSTCGGSVAFVTSSTCSAPLAQAIVSGCGTPASNISSAWYGRYTPNPSGTCTASASTLSGSVSPQGTRTVCCLP